MARGITALLTLALLAPNRAEPVPVAGRGAGGGARGPAIVIEGRGWGHGRGLGQWGARTMAARGLSWQRIVTHYYAGVRVGHRSNVSMRVLLVRSPEVIVAAAKWPVRAPRRDARADVFRARVTARGMRLEASRRPAGPWREARTSSARLVFRPRRSLMRLVYASGEVRAYRGSLEVRREGPSLVAILTVPLEEYLLGVLPREMPASWPFESLKAQAVAARTYALRVRRSARARGALFDICASARCQVFGGSARYVLRRRITLENSRTNAAVRATARRVITWRGDPILAQYSSSTGGYTAPGGAPYLRAVLDPGDAASPRHAWTVRVARAVVERRWPAIGRLRSVTVTRRNGLGEWGGRVRRLVLRGTSGAVAVSGDEFRRALGLRSDWFRIRAPRAYVFRFDLAFGARSIAVRQLQRRLRAEGFYPRGAPVTGFFGPITRASLRRYQRAHKIRPTGNLGPITRARLNR